MGLTYAVLSRLVLHPASPCPISSPANRLGTLLRRKGGVLASNSVANEDTRERSGRGLSARSGDEEPGKTMKDSLASSVVGKAIDTLGRTW